jgi:CheY-like chemotaxis protein
LLAFGRRKQLRPAPVDAERLLQDIRLLLERTLGEGVRLQVEMQPGLRPAFADASQLDAALVNLALNARDAMPDGGLITFAVDDRWIAPGRGAPGLKPGHYIVYSVIDTGAGMPPDVASRAVEPFFSTKGGRGSGLGLSMVYGFVEQSGGGMEIRSTLGAGTSVSLFLPVAPEVKAAPVAGSATSMAMQPGRALIVEDDDEVRAVAAAFLRSFGYVVVTVPNHDAAIERLGEDGGGFDVIFSDLMLGSGPDGVALANYAKSRWPAIAIVITSGHAQGSQADPGAFELLQKPYDREQLAAALARSRQSAKAG